MELQADVVAGCPFYLPDFQDRYFAEVLSFISGSLQEKSILVLGLAGVGKTAALNTIMAAVSRFRKRRA
eukprot:12844653-Alexandrium_andersonii.AAC.1